MKPTAWNRADPGDSDPGSSKPTPDPTVLTTDAIARASQADRDWTSGRIEVLCQRIDGIDKANEVLAETVNRFPTLLDREIQHLRERMDLQFQGIAAQIAERDLREELRAGGAKVAIDAALSAQKEAATLQELNSARAIGKAESATVDTISKLAELLKATTDSLAANTIDLKERVGKIENVKTGGREQMTAIYAFVGFLVTLLVLGGMLAAAGFFGSK